MPWTTEPLTEAERSDKILEMKNISKSFPGVQALADVNIDLYRGEILAICGENGAGKSTLMNILSGSYGDGDFSGEILVDGHPIKFQSTSDAKKVGIEMIYQEISLHLDLSVAENLLLGTLPKTRFGFIDWRRIREEAREALFLVGLNVEVATTIRRLSTSQQQLLTIARALIRNPKILVLDEPTSALTETEAQNLLSLIRGLKDRAISCIYISHKLEEVLLVADRIVVLRDGRLISTNERQACDRNRIVEDMVGRRIENLFPKETVEIGDEVLRVEDLSVPHPFTNRKKILDGISFSVRRGEILGIAGLVGSGRSELLGAIFSERTEGVTGKIYIEGQAVKFDSPRDAKHGGLGFLTEDRKKSGLVGTMDIAKNISLASIKQILRGAFISYRKERALAESFVHKLTIRAPSISTNVMKLSGGNQQKVVLSRWLTLRPKVLLLDEPTRGIDVGAKVDIYRLMTDLAKQGVAIVLVTSEMTELIAMSDRLVVLSNGKIQKEFAGRRVTQEEIMAAITSN